MNLTSKQWFQIISGIVSGLITGAALLTTLFGPDLTPKIIAGLGILNVIISSIGTTVSGEGNLAKDVAALPGVKLKVNEQASPALAALAVDPGQPNIGAESPDLRPKLQEIAKG